MPGIVKTTATKTIITDIPSFSYAEGRDSLVLAAQAAGRALGRDEPYPMLKGLSALAFRLLFPTNWRRYTPDALCGFNHTQLLFDQLGLSIAPTRSAGQDDSQRMIVESIRKGFPVLALHLMEWEDWGVIAGFGGSGEKLFCRTPHDGRGAPLPENGTEQEQSDTEVPQPPVKPLPYSRHKHWPNMLLVITGEHPAPDRREAIRTALRTAVELYDTDQYGPYYGGKNSYLKWVEGLRDSAWYVAQGEPQESGYATWIKHIRRPEKENINEDRAYDQPYLERAHVNAWRLESLIDARIAAGSFLNNIALEYFRGTANTAVRMNIQQAAIHYNWLVAQLISIRPFVRWDDELDQSPWTQAMRDRQADLLSSARFIEEQGVVKIRAALEEMK